MGSLEGKVVVITGAGRGIGRATALHFAAEGARLVVNDVGCDVDGTGSDDSVIAGVSEEIVRAGGEVVASAEDLTDPEVPGRLVETAVQRFGRLDAVVSNAGLFRERSLLNADLESLDAIWRVHVRAPYALAQRAARTLVDQKEGGAILFTAGAGAFFGAARQSALAAAHAATVATTRSTALELRKHGVRVNALAPTARTRSTEHLPTFQGIRADSMGPEHVAPVAAFLVSDLGQDVSGEIVGVAGSRIYTLRGRESTGAFLEGRAFGAADVRDAWNEISRG